MNKPERLWLPSGVKLRSDDPDKPGAPRLAGYAAKFGSEYRPYEQWGDPDFIETIAPGAFERTLEEKPDVRALYNHDTSSILGRTASGTLKLSEDEVGLAFDCELPDTQLGRDVAALVARGDLTGCSFGFMVKKHSIEDRCDGVTVCTLEDVDLFEVSIAVAFPAYEDTEVSLRAKGRRGRKSDQPHPTLEWARRRLQIELYT